MPSELLMPNCHSNVCSEPPLAKSNLSQNACVLDKKYSVLAWVNCDINRHGQVEKELLIFRLQSGQGLLGEKEVGK